MTITTAMVLAAGKGVRMQPLTLSTPKPLLKVGGRTMIDHVLDRLAAAHIQRVVVNASYLGDQIKAHVQTRHDLNIAVSQEDEPLETGGGIKQALPLLGDDPVFVINSDLPWTEGKIPALARLQRMWDPARMDVLLLVLPQTQALGFTKSDFSLLPDGRLQRHNNMPLTHVFLGVQIAKPPLYRAVDQKIFSSNLIFDQAEAQGRLYGLAHDGSCFHVGTPPDLAAAQDWVR